MTLLEYLENHLSREKANFILSFLDDANCLLVITRPRKTKLGDFRMDRNNLRISINHDMNSFRFLFTLVHEIAHLVTYKEYGRKVKPHGREWKDNFKKMFYSFDLTEEFGKDEVILATVLHELENPKACSGVSLAVERAFATYDKTSTVYLEEIPEGGLFIFRGRRYKKLKTNRTRVVCLNMDDNRKYTINKAASVILC